MPYADFYFAPDQTESDIALRPAFSHFAKPHFATPLIEASIEAYEAGAEAALIAPVLWYGIESSIRLLKIPSIRNRLPGEVTLRSLIAGRQGNVTGRDGCDRNLFLHVYAENDLLRPYLHDKDLVEKLSDSKYLESFMGAPWSEASQIIAGGYRALLESGATGDLVESVASSRSLQTVALLPAELRVAEAKDYLGWPYAYASHYKVGETEGKSTIALTRDTLTFLGKLMMSGRGCTAADIHLKADLPGFKGSFPGTLLQRAFAEMAGVLLQGEPVITTDPDKLLAIMA